MRSPSLLRELVSEMISEWRVDTDMTDVYKELLPTFKGRVKFDPQDAVGILHVWLYNNGLLRKSGSKYVFTIEPFEGDTPEFHSAYEHAVYRNLVNYAKTRYEGLIRQYGRSKNPVQSAQSALPFWILNHYNSQIVSGKLRRMLLRGDMASMSGG